MYDAILAWLRITLLSLLKYEETESVPEHARHTAPLVNAETAFANSILIDFAPLMRVFNPVRLSKLARMASTEAGLVEPLLTVQSDNEISLK